MSTDKAAATRQQLRQALLQAYRSAGLWGASPAYLPLPPGVARGSDVHLAFLTLVTAVSGGRDPHPLWTAAGETYAADPELFDPQFLAYIQPREIEDRLKAHKLLHKKSEATVWQRIGQALVMRAGGSVSRLLAAHQYDAPQLLAMLTQNKATFPLLSGPQTAPRWLYVLFAAGNQPLTGASRLPTPVSPAAARALQSLQIETDRVSAESFAALNALGTHGCIHRNEQPKSCAAAAACPVASFCEYGQGDQSGPIQQKTNPQHH